MFATAKQRPSSIRTMQLFHELKPRFPTIPDHILTACIISHFNTESPDDLYELVLARITKDQIQMGRPSIQVDTPSINSSPVIKKQLPELENIQEQTEAVYVGEMKSGDDEGNVSEAQRLSEEKIHTSNGVARRPNTLNINKSEQNEACKIQLSEKCRNLPKLLNSTNLSQKPPKSPLSLKKGKKQGEGESPTFTSPRKDTVSTPTQTTDTLLNNNKSLSPSLNLSLNLNCQVETVPNSSKSKCTSRIELIPTQPWLNPNTFLNDPASARSFTSVNLTLRPPTSIPQDPIDITSQNSSLTYSTSSFDKEKGLQSRLQITVGPGNAGSVSSVRARPRSFHSGDNFMEVVPVRTGSLSDLATVVHKEPLLQKQQARIDRMRIEVQSGNSRLVILRQEVEDLEKRLRQKSEKRALVEMEKQLKVEIRHLTSQCEQLADLLDKDEFYNNIYTGPSGPLLSAQPARPISATPHLVERPTRNQVIYRRPSIDFSDRERRKWDCSVCTFLNHPDLDKCEQCDMPRVYHGMIQQPVLTLDALSNTPNPDNFDMSFEMFRKSAIALKKSVSTGPQCWPFASSNALSVNEMLRKLRINENDSISVNNNNIVSLSTSASAPNMMHSSMDANGLN